MKQSCNEIICDICIVGAGSAGMGAAYAFIGTEWKVVIVDTNSKLGGTAVNAWVQTWIEGINPPYLENILLNFGFNKKDLERSILPKKYSNLGYNISLKSDKLASIYQKDMDAQKSFILLQNNSFCEVSEMDNGIVKEIQVSDGDDRKRIRAKFFIDSSGDGVLCRSASPIENEDFYVGEDPYSRFKEALMPLSDEHDPKTLNEPSLFYKVSSDAHSDKERLREVKSVYLDKNKMLVKPDYITDDGYINSLFLNPMTGLGLSGYEILGCVDWAYREAEKRQWEHWKYVKTGLDLWRGYRTGEFNYNHTGCYAPMLGIRESYRIRCDRMLVQDDLTVPINPKKLERSIACGSHTLDFHVWKTIDWYEVQSFNQNKIVPSGIAYDCLIPWKLKNVLVACRAFGASHIALSARRINKDMAQLGWAAGWAIKQCLENELDEVRDVDVQQVQKESGFIDNVELLDSLYINR